ncbi:hypothetical protein KAR91_71500 [Candidatus Pacearchaeota archaeon]|nr:hypothetical protein [Candidatus Pacearchaeota archaeon]
MSLWYARNVGYPDMKKIETSGSKSAVEAKPEPLNALLFALLIREVILWQ